METLAKFLGAQDPRPEAARSESDFDQLVNISDPKEFCKRVVASREFRQYIMNGIVLSMLPPAVVTRIIDHAWGKPVERIEVSDPLELVNLTPELATKKLERVQQMLQLLRRAQMEDNVDPTSVH